METVSLSKMQQKRNSACGEYGVKFATGEIMWLPPRLVSQKPVFQDGKLVTVEASDTMTDELQALCDELVETTDGEEIFGRTLEVLFQIAAKLLTTTYDLDDNDLTELLTFSYGTSEHQNIKEQWPNMVYLWVIGGAEMTEMLNV